MSATKKNPSTAFSLTRTPLMNACLRAERAVDASGTRWNKDFLIEIAKLIPVSIGAILALLWLLDTAGVISWA